MHFSASYRQYELYKELDEIKFPISLLSNAINTASQYPDKRIIVHITDIESADIALDKLLSLLIETSNLFLELYNIQDVITLSSQLLTRHCIERKLFYHHAATSFNMIYFLLKHNVSDIVVGEPIVFDLSEVRKMVPKDSGVILRADPVQGRPILFESIKNVDDGLYHFWALPQSVPFYDNYIDVFDLSDSNKDRESTLITVFKRGEYIHSLASLCRAVENQVPCAMFSEENLRYRVTCKQRCIRDNCHRCRIVADMYLLRMKDNNNVKNF